MGGVSCRFLTAIALTVASAGVPALAGNAQAANAVAGLPRRAVTDRVALVATPTGQGYWIADANGAVVPFGDASAAGDLSGRQLAQPVVAMASDLTGGGYWLTDAAGAVHSFGDAPALTGLPAGLALNGPILGMAATRSGHGCWLLGTDGGVFSFGDAFFHGSTGGIRLNQPIVAMATTPSGNGYWLVASDGGVFSFGDATFHGSTGGIRLNQPVVAMVATPSGNGYWLIASDGGVFTFGDAVFVGSLGGAPAPAPVVAATPSPGGYWLLGRDGHVSPFGAAPDFGSDEISPFGVGLREFTVSDPGRPTWPRGGQPGHPGRTLPTTVLYPTASAPAPTDEINAQPAQGPFPLVVFAPGFDASPATYDVLLREWAAAGYVVAAPEFPLSGPDGPGPPSEADLIEQPGDVSAVIGAVLGEAAVPGDWLAGVIDAGRVAVAGQSDGGSTVAGVALNSASSEHRISAAIVMSGSPLALPGGTYGSQGNVPVLVIQGDSDTSNRPADALAVYGDARDPKAYLDVLGGGHLGPYLDASWQAQLVRAATIGFLDRTLRGDVDGLVRLHRGGNWPGLTALRSSLP